MIQKMKYTTWKAHWMPGLSPVPIPESLARAWPPPSLLFNGPGRLDPSIFVLLPCKGVFCVTAWSHQRERERQRERGRALFKERRLMEQEQMAAILSRLPVCASQWAHSRCSIKDLWNKRMNEWTNGIQGTPLCVGDWIQAPLGAFPDWKPWNSKMTSLFPSQVQLRSWSHPSVKAHSRYLVDEANANTSIYIFLWSQFHLHIFKFCFTYLYWFQIEKGVHQGCILSPCLFNFYHESTSSETLGWRKHKLESRLPGEISITSDMQVTPPLWQKVKNN